ncbi:MAG: hypothetical protein M3N18_10000 [Actinomycetota bacterium]|nr:hypothetical protein [Actinomycetota bacterium]
MNDRARDERVRAAVKRIKAAEQEERDRKQAARRGVLGGGPGPAAACVGHLGPKGGSP